jgi:dCTP deaminase
MPSDAAGTLFSKSSTGRILLEHLHAGYFDPDFHGQATFEFFNDGPWAIEMRPGERLVQLRLEQMIAPPLKSYLETGHYNGQSGPTPAKS